MALAFMLLLYLMSCECQRFVCVWAATWTIMPKCLSGVQLDTGALKGPLGTNAGSTIGESVPFFNVYRHIFY